MTRQQKRDSLAAGAITLAVLLLLSLLLLFGHISYNTPDMASTKPEIAMLPEDEEEFIEPELLQELGEPESEVKDEAAPAVPTPPAPEKKVSSRKKIQEKEPEKPTVTAREKEDVASRMSKFEKKTSSQGAGGVGMGINGVASGRVFKGCPKPQVSLSHKVTVTVSVTINAEGNVLEAHARGGASADIRRACEAAARRAKWSPKPDAPTTKGTITFSITPV